MASLKNNWRDYIWLSWFALQVLVIIFVDAVPFYPRWLYEPADSPLHFLQRIRADYIATYNDPIVQWTPESGRDSWIPLFTHIEMLFQLPTALFAVHRLGKRRAGTTGSNELLYLVYALETALTTLVCLNDVFWWDDEIYPTELKRSFLFNIYGPWFAIPTLMFVDMYFRLLRRVSPNVAAGTSKKTQ